MDGSQNSVCGRESSGGGGGNRVRSITFAQGKYKGSHKRVATTVQSSDLYRKYNTNVDVCAHVIFSQYTI